MPARTATGPLASPLTEQHRLAQLRIGSLLAAQVGDLWRLMGDGTALDDATTRWLRAVIPIVQLRYQQSAVLAAGYYGAMRTAAVGPTGYLPTPADDLQVEALITSLTVTGPARTKSAMTRMSLDDAMRLGESGSAAAAMRYGLAGGRDTLLKSMREDRRATGFQRVTSGNACAFCEDLADSTYTTEADFEAHDACACTAEPVFG